MTSDIAREDAEALIHQKRAEYEASQEFQEMRSIGAAEIAIYGLLRAAEMSTRGACVGAAMFIDKHGDDIPEVDWWANESPRRSAMLWAEQASQVELMAFATAAISQLEESPLTIKQLKKMVALSFRRLPQQDKEGFIAWAKTQVSH